MIGDKLGAYEIEEEIGRGGMGRVYRATQPSLGRTVAVKVLPADLARDDEFVERFMREARATARLRHPNIVTVHDVGEQEGTYYFAMEYLPGRTLEDVIAEGGPLPVARATRITVQLARALEHAHRHEILHRDIKPANVMLEGNDRAILTDFGIARAASQTRLTQTGSTVGTPAYMSPEQVQGRSLDRRSDLYSLGVILFEMLTGELPYQGNTPPMVAYQHVNSPVRSVREVRQEVPEPLDAIVQRLMAKDPEERFDSAGEVVRTLEEIGRQVAVQAVEESEPQPGGQATIPIEESGEEATLLIDESGGEADLPVEESGEKATIPAEELEDTEDFSSVPIRWDSSPRSSGRDSSASDPPWSSPFAIVAASLMAILLGLGAYAYYSRGPMSAPAAGGVAGEGSGANLPTGSEVPAGSGVPVGARAEAPSEDERSTPETAAMAGEDEETDSPTATAPGEPGGEAESGSGAAATDEATGAALDDEQGAAPEGPADTERDGADGLAADEPGEPAGGEPGDAAASEDNDEPEAAAPSPETFTITSRPEGATVSLDGEVLPDRTPLEIDLLPDTPHDLELSLEGHESTSFRFALEDLSEAQRSDRELHFPLPSSILPGTLRIDGNFDVQIEIDGDSYELAGGDEIPLPPGSYEATLTAPELFYSERRSIDITSEESTELELPPTTTLTVAAAPSYCRVFIDGIDVGFVPTTVRIVLGSHEFRFDWETLDQTKTVTREVGRDTERIFEVPPERSGVQ